MHEHEPSSQDSGRPETAHMLELPPVPEPDEVMTSYAIIPGELFGDYVLDLHEALSSVTKHEDPFVNEPRVIEDEQGNKMVVDRDSESYNGWRTQHVMLTDAMGRKSEHAFSRTLLSSRFRGEAAEVTERTAESLKLIQQLASQQH